MRAPRKWTNSALSLPGSGKMTLLLPPIDGKIASRGFCQKRPRSVAAKTPPGFSNLRQRKNVVFPTASKTKSKVSPIRVKSSAVKSTAQPASPPPLPQRLRVQAMGRRRRSAATWTASAGMMTVRRQEFIALGEERPF